LSRKERKNYCKTVIIFDGDNLEISLKRIGLWLSNLRLFINNFFEKNDSLTGMENREGMFFNPIVYIVSKRVGEINRKEQNLYLNKLKKNNAGLVKLSVVHPKRSSNGYWISCTDSEISSFIAIALLDKSIEKIILVSGDGDFLRPLKLIGIGSKKICSIGIEGSTSKQLVDYVNLMGGKSFIIEKQIPGLSEIENKKDKRKGGRDNKFTKHYLGQHQ